MKKTRVIVLGAAGMLGHTVHNYLKENRKLIVYGTSHKPHKLLIKFNALSSVSWKKVFALSRPDYVINCIGLLRNYPDKNIPSSALFKSINTDFPKYLESQSSEQKFNLIHISTDAVFPIGAKVVTESMSPEPKGIYAKTKYKGEVHGQNSLTIRTSILGYDSLNGRGFLEWVKNSRSEITGYTNHLWSGSTTLQVAQLINWMISKRGFEKVKKYTPLIHYAPLGPVRKYHLIGNIIDVNNISTNIIKAKAKKSVSRYLASEYLSLLPKYLLDNTIVSNLDKLKKFESRRN